MTDLYGGGRATSSEELTALVLEARRQGVSYGRLVANTDAWELKKIIKAYCAEKNERGKDMGNNLTWLKPSGEWGIEGVDLKELPPKVYGALCKLMELEHPMYPTRGDQLRAMSDEKLALWLCNAVVIPAVCPLLGLDAKYFRQDAKDGMVRVCMDWLGEPGNVSDSDTFPGGVMEHGQ